jgi:hypothetical protein
MWILTLAWIIPGIVALIGLIVLFIWIFKCNDRKYRWLLWLAVVCSLPVAGFIGWAFTH